MFCPGLGFVGLFVLFCVLGDLFCFCNFVVVVAQNKKGKRERGKWDSLFSIKTSSFGGLMILIQGFEICLRIFFYEICGDF